MAATRQVLQIFLSSPGDVGAQREVARETIGRLGKDPLVAERFALEVIGWDNMGARVPLSANQTPQLSVNEYILLPHKCDLTIVILWGRLGTPVPLRASGLEGRSIKSGTLWELDDALLAGKPVWLYRKTAIPLIELTDIDFELKRKQLREVDDFLATSMAKDGSLLFGVHHFVDDEDLRSQLGEHLRHFIRKNWDEHYDPPMRRGGEVKVPLVNLGRDAASDAVDSASIHLSEPREGSVVSKPLLCALARYPIGPMVKDIEVRCLAEAFAELHHSDDSRTTFAEINEALREAAGLSDPPLRLALVMFATTRGSKHFWEDVLHHAAMQGPRMLSAVLRTVNAEMLERDASREYVRLVERVNCYV